MTTHANTRPSLPTDLDALARLHGLTVRGTGDTREAFEIHGSRSLRVWWDDMGPDDAGWSWETKHGRDHDSGALDSVHELGELVSWLTGL